METLECGPLSDPMLCTALNGSGSISPNLLISAHNNYFGPATTAFNHPQFHANLPHPHLDEGRFLSPEDFSCSGHLLLNPQQCGFLIEHGGQMNNTDTYASNAYIQIKYEYDDGMHKAALSPCISPQLAPTVDESVQQIQYQFECANNPHVSDQHPNIYLDQQQTPTSIHENVQNGYAVFHPEDGQLVQPKLEQIYDPSTIAYECYMPSEIHADQEPSSSSNTTTSNSIHQQVKYSPPIAQNDHTSGNDLEELNTRELAQRISSELKRFSIPQAIFAQKVLCRSQGTLSDLLRNPKPWNKLKSGRETFRRMANWLKEPEIQRMSALRLAVVSACKRKEESSGGTQTKQQNGQEESSPAKKSRPSPDVPADPHADFRPTPFHVDLDSTQKQMPVFL